MALFEEIRFIIIIIIIKFKGIEVVPIIVISSVLFYRVVYDKYGCFFFHYSSVVSNVLVTEKSFADKTGG